MGTISEKLTYLNETKTKLKNVINYSGTNITDDTFRSYPEKLYDKFVDFVTNGTDSLYSSLPKVTGEDTELTLNNTANGVLKLDFKGNTSQDGEPTPENPQDIHVVTGDNDITIKNQDNTQSQTYRVSLGIIELCKIGDYQDYIYKENGNWYKYNAVGKLILDGSENWLKSSNTNVDRYALGINLYLKNTSSLCNYFIRGASSNYNIGFWYNNNDVQVLFNFAPYGTTTINDWKTWLSTHNLILYQPLVTPTSTQITDTTLISQLEALENAVSYEDETNISQTNADLPFVIGVSAIKKYGEV